MASNQVTFRGRLANDNDMRYTKSGTPVLSNSIAVERQYADKNGNHQTDFFRFVIWNKSAENFNRMVSKGDRIGLSGNLQNNQYKNKDGVDVTVAELQVREIDLIETKRDKDAARQAELEQNSMYRDEKGMAPLTDDDFPF